MKHLNLPIKILIQDSKKGFNENKKAAWFVNQAAFLFLVVCMSTDSASHRSSKPY